MKQPECLRFVGSVSCALLLASCVAQIPEDDAGSSVDAGVADAGELDAGLVSVDDCAGKPPVVVDLAPREVRVNGAATVLATGGTGHYRFLLTTNASSGKLNGDRYVAGPTPGVDVVTAVDTCGAMGTKRIVVSASFEVLPARATLRPDTQFSLQLNGLKGAAQFSPRTGLPSGGSITNTADGGFQYTAGRVAATDLIAVSDTMTGEQVLLQYRVTPAAFFRPRSPKLALPTGASVPLETLDGSGLASWRLMSGEGALDGGTYRAPETATTAVLEGRDVFTKEVCRVDVRVLTELTRSDQVPQGRRGDSQTMVTGDFNGDRVDDIAVGVPDSDLLRPQGGAVLIFLGSATGFPASPSFVIKGDTDTAQLGFVMAAGDLNGDGKDELAVAEPGADVTVADSGAVALYTFTADGPQQLRAPLTGLGRGRFGASLAIADIDGDGDNDLVIGSPGADLAAPAFTGRGVIDIYVLARGQPIPDTGTIRLSGVDLTTDGGTKPTSNTQLGRGVVVADFNNDQRVDIASVTSVNATSVGGVGATRTQIAVQVHFGRASGQRFEQVPDLYVLPSTAADAGVDGDEGTWRLGFVPATMTTPPMLAAVADRIDAPNLAVVDAGTVGGANTGGALLFDLSDFNAATAPSGKPVQRSRDDAFARLYGDATTIQAGRSFAFVDVDQDLKPEVVLGAPYASGTLRSPLPDGGTASVATSYLGKLQVYSLSTLTRGVVKNRPDTFLQGTARADGLGTALVGVRTQGRTTVVSVAGRATTAQGEFIGRVDFFDGMGAFSSWAHTSVDIPAVRANQAFGTSVEVQSVNGVLRTLVSQPNHAGRGLDLLGNELNAGQVVLFGAGMPRLVAEGATTPYVPDGGSVRAFGGRPIGSDVTSTDFNGDGLADWIVSASAFPVPVKNGDGGSSLTEYATNRLECFTDAGTSQSPGALLVFASKPDGTVSEGYRLWGMRDISDCVVPDGGSVAICQRSALGRTGVVGGFDFNGDGKQDVLALRTNGAEVFLGRAADDPSFAKPTMVCDPTLSFPFIAQPTTVAASLGDLDNDGCDEVGFRYADGTRQGIALVFGFSRTGGCMGHSQPSWLRISGDAEAGVALMRLGVSLTRAGKVVANDQRDFIAIGADFFPYLGDAQPVVLLVAASELTALRPASGERVVGIIGDVLTPIPILYRERAPGLGRMLFGNVDVTGDGKPDLVVSATAANINGDGTGAVFVFAGGTVREGPNESALTIVSDERERASFGQDLSVCAGDGGIPAGIAIGAPLSYRTGTSNGTAYVLPTNF